MTSERDELQVSAIVLAAGKGSRMGQVKQLIRLGGEPLLAHVLATVRAAGLNDIIVVLGAAAGEIEKHVALGGFRLVRNPAYEEGLASSVQIAISQVPKASAAAVIFLADQPLVLPSTVLALINAYRESNPVAVVPTYHGHRGLPVVLDRALFPRATELKGDEGFRSILHKLNNVIQVEVDDPGIVLDVDTADDLVQCEELFRKRGSAR